MAANVDLVRAIFDAWQHGDFDSAAWADPGIVFVLADGPSPGSWEGLDGMIEGWRDFLRAWEHWRGEAEQYRELDSERVLVLIHGTGRGKASGLEAAQMGSEGANLFHVSGGRVKRLVVYFNRETAFADLGLSHEADAANAPD
jgi:ketosteroid isomerase-like protein